MREVIAEFETRRKGAPDAYGDAGCRLSGLNNFAMALRHERYTNDSHDTIYLFARPPEAGAQVFIEVCPADSASKDWQKLLSFYEQQRSDFRLPPGQKFDASYLLPAASGFVRHDAFRTRDGRTRRRVVHAFEGTERNVLIVFSLDSNDLQRSLFIGAVRDGLVLSNKPIGKPFLRK